jgi:hypothetical protein
MLSGWEQYCHSNNELNYALAPFQSQIHAGLGMDQATLGHGIGLPCVPGGSESRDDLLAVVSVSRRILFSSLPDTHRRKPLDKNVFHPT